jgi:hypothetical protein
MTQQLEQQPYEQILFHRQKTHGVFRKHIILDQMITNKFVTQQTFNDKGISTGYQKLPLNQFYAIQSINVHRIGSGTHYTTSFGSYGIRNYVGSSNYSSQSVGDVVFLSSTMPAIIIRGVSDPNGVARMATASRKQFIQNSVKAGMQGMFGK